MAVNAGQKFEGYAQIDNISLDDVWIIIDKSDTTMSPGGTTKYCTSQQMSLFFAAATNSAVQNRYLSITQMVADQANQTDANIQFAADASLDPSVSNGYAYYEYLGVANGLLSDYRKLSPEEAVAIETNHRTFEVKDVSATASLTVSIGQIEIEILDSKVTYFRFDAQYSQFLARNKTDLDADIPVNFYIDNLTQKNRTNFKVLEINDDTANYLVKVEQLELANNFAVRDKVEVMIDYNSSTGNSSQQNTGDGGNFDGTLDMSNQNAGTKFNPYDIGINGSIIFSLGGNEVDFGFDWLPIISDGATSFLTNLDFFIIKQGVPEGNVLPSGEGYLLMYNTPNGVGISYMQKVSEIGTFFEYLFTGNLNDTSGNSNTAFLNGTVALTADRNAVSNAGYLVPSGVTNYIDYNNIIFENGISIAFWVHSISGDLAGTYIICDEDLGVFVGNSPNGNGNIALSRKGFGATPVIDSGVDVSGSHFICLTITDAGAATFYVDDMSTPVGTADLSGATFYGNYKSGAVASSIDIKLDNMYFYGGVINEAKRIELKAQN